LARAQSETLCLICTLRAIFQD